MKKRVQFIALVLSLVLLLGTVAFAAGSYTKEITASYVGISLVVDGVPVTPKDANGKVVEPFIYEGTTYLPVRAVGEALGKKVTWDGPTKTVYVGQVPGEETYLLDVCPPYQSHGYTGYTYGKSVTMGGKQYTNSFSLGTSWESSYAVFNLNGEYQSAVFLLGHIDGSGDANKTVTVFLDGIEYSTYSVNYLDLPTSITIPLNGALQLRIERSDGSTQTGFADFKLY